MADTDVLVVGGGPAGLSAAGALKVQGIDAVVLDKDDRIGGSWSRRYDRLHLHTVRAFSGLAHHPLSWRLPRYVSKDQYAAYLQEYARHFALRCEMNCTVRKVRPVDDAKGRGFEVETDGERWRSRVVVVATGQFGAPVLPDWPGAGEYQGRLFHSSLYKSARAYAGQRVLVIGAGNSGAEIAADLAEEGAAFVALSVRTPPPIVPRDLLGTPVQVFGIVMSSFPPRLADRIGHALARMAMGDLTRYGLARPAWLPFESKRVPIIDVGLVRQVKAGRVAVRPAVTRLTRGGVVYADGREESFDVVVAATGFTTGLEALVEVPGVIGKNGLPRSASGEETGQPGLYFLGYVESHRGHLYEASRASRRLALTVRRYLSGA